MRGNTTEAMKPLQVFIGYDPKEAVTWHVAAHSILTRASGPVSITPVASSTLKTIYTRERHPGQSTDFAFSRFLTPYLAGPGISIFMDSDMLVLCDIYELAKLAMDDIYTDVFVVKHVYEPKPGNKFLNQKQTSYPCKNWSSVMVFNGHRQAVRRLTPEYVNKASPADLHQFKWADAVGEIPPEYNHLVGEFPHNSGAKIVHYTLGAPCFQAYQNCDYSGEWFEELGRMTHCDDPILELVQNANLSGLHQPHSGRHPEPDLADELRASRDQHGDPPAGA
jgi:hypothetical protein